ncbi:MAG: ceramidase [Cytophagaceae bacterium]|jgi:hypothetical protein|nr:ceramidase [Cytophagaceae bacterium]
MSTLDKRFLLVLGLLSIVFLYFKGSIPQEEHYHQFADQRYLGIPNAFNVWSNIPFLICGVWGFIQSKTILLSGFQKIQYAALFLGIMLTAFGSSYYHWNPNSTTLVWDRLPMTVVFASFFACVLSDTFSATKEKVVWTSLLLFGFFSIGYWVLWNDLRFYVFLQFFPILYIIWCVLRNLFPNRVKKSVVLIIGCYGIAKLMEHYDYSIYAYLGSNVSGHSLKHLFASISTFGIVRYSSLRLT